MTAESFCTLCVHYRSRLFRKATCRRILETDPVTDDPTVVYERPVRVARLEDCKGLLWELDPDHACW